MTSLAHKIAAEKTNGSIAMGYGLRNSVGYQLAYKWESFEYLQASSSNTSDHGRRDSIRQTNEPRLDSYSESMRQVLLFKHKIENTDLYMQFYSTKTGLLDANEKKVQSLFHGCWQICSFCILREPNNGRGSVDFHVSKGSPDVTLIEIKMGYMNKTQLKQNLKHQVRCYEKTFCTKKSIKVVLFFSVTEKKKINNILAELELTNDKSIVLIDARNDNKISASKITDANVNF